jgi:hypothetical protein
LGKTPNWSKAEDDILNELWPNPNVTADDMDKILTLRTKNAILKRISDKGIHKERPSTDINLEELKKLRKVISF